MTRVAILTVGLCAVLAVPSASAGNTPTSGISGVVRNTTCPGPCQTPPPPAPLYTGDGLVVRARSAATHEIVAQATPKDGRFHLDVGPGLYVVHAHVEGKCWKGSRHRAGIVDRGAWVRLTVHNVCVV